MYDQLKHKADHSTMSIELLQTKTETKIIGYFEDEFSNRTEFGDSVTMLMHIIEMV